MLPEVKPIKVLRDFLKTHPRTAQFSSQQGIARVGEHSESLVRAIEGGRLKMSRRFAERLAFNTGASPDWLRNEEVDSYSIPSARGGRLTIEEVLFFMDKKI